MADVEWKLLPTPMWPEGSVMADQQGFILEVSFEEGVPTWKVQRRVGKDALPDVAAGGTADSFEAAKAAALHMAAELQAWGRTGAFKLRRCPEYHIAMFVISSNEISLLRRS
jgi:hypothetical protein